MVETAKALNLGIRCVVRTHNEEEARLLREETGGTVLVGEHELARSMTRHVLDGLALAQAQAQAH
jgi:CPA2 family monovalent cation:H+ antiporter-2